jgi:hypothetical protein
VLSVLNDQRQDGPDEVRHIRISRTYGISAGTHLVSSLNHTSDADLLDPQPWFVSHDTILHYLEGFADHAGLNAVTQYNTNVARIGEAGGGRWKVCTTDVPLQDQGPYEYHCSRKKYGPQPPLIGSLQY